MEIIKAIKHLAFFIPGYTILPRWLEVAYGLLFWLCIPLILYAPLRAVGFF